MNIIFGYTMANLNTHSRKVSDSPHLLNIGKLEFKLVQVQVFLRAQRDRDSAVTVG